MLTNSDTTSIAARIWSLVADLVFWSYYIIILEKINDESVAVKWAMRET